MIVFTLTGDHPKGWDFIQRGAGYMYYLYVLQSDKGGSTYIGSCNDLRLRVQQHNTGRTKSIKHKLPMRLIYYEAYIEKVKARKRELELKNNNYQKEILYKRLFDK